MFSLELIDEVVDQAVVEVLTTQVSVTGSRLDFEDSLLDSEERHIESSSTKVENENVPLALSLLVETICDGRRSRLVDDTENIQASNETSVFSGLALRVVEVGRDSDHGIVDSASKV